MFKYVSRGVYVVLALLLGACGATDSAAQPTAPVAVAVLPPATATNTQTARPTLYFFTAVG